VGALLDAKRYAEMPREQMLAELKAAIQACKDRAEKLRRKS
jgi:hypothetical protein